MSNDLLKISLNQGKQFTNYQTKIKKGISKSIPKRATREGLVTMEQESMIQPTYAGYVSVLQAQQRGSTLTNYVNQKDLDELKNLQSRYTDLMQQYTSIQTSISDSSLSTINRLSKNNPYLNKSIKFTTGPISYVTAQGVAKFIPSTDVWNSNNIPKDYIDIGLPWIDSYGVPGTIIPTNPTLISGTPLQLNESIGNEGKNVYASTLTNNPSSTYVGCYSDQPAATETLLVPVMGQTNEVNGFTATASSVYQNNNSFTGPWNAFDNNINTWWHSEVVDGFLYDGTTGQYLGNSSVSVIMTTGEKVTIPGEWLQISFPNQSLYTVTKYSIQGRQGCCGQPNGRDPNTWYILGLKDNQWYEVDYQSNISFNWSMLTFNISNPQAWSSYAIVTTVAGDPNAAAGNRTCVQIATWNLYSSSGGAGTGAERAMIWNPDVIGYTSVDKCQQYAADGGYQYFGMQDYQSNGTAACLVSNDVTKTTAYGDAKTQVTVVPIWSSNTATGQANNCYVSGTGQLTIALNGAIVSNTNDVAGSCQSWGTITVTSATYGGNCKAPIGNVTGQVGQQPGVVQPVACNWTDSCSIPISNQTFGDPAVGCGKSFDIEYTCGGITTFTKNLPYAEGQTMIVDCRDHQKENCQFFLVLQDDGNMCIYKGTDPSDNKGSVWCTMTNGKQQSPNPDWVSSKGKFGRNYLKLGEGLSTNEWISSTDGSLYLVMQSDGNLVLYTSVTKAGCTSVDNKTYGGPWVNAVYKLDAAGNAASLGKLGYVDSESNLREYPDSMLSYSNDYQIYTNTDSGGNDITSLIVTDENGCRTACNNNSGCAAYAYMPSSKTCWLKNSSTFPKASKYPLSDRNFGVRKPIINPNPGCTSEIANVDTIQYDNYIKGQAMDPNAMCNESLVSQEDRAKFDDIKNQLVVLGQDITSKMEKLYNQDNKIYEKLHTNAQQFKKDLERYKTVSQELQSNNNIEGMRNMNDINGMLTDTDLRVLQENYGYLLWSILAVGVLTITINAMKK